MGIDLAAVKPMIEGGLPFVKKLGVQIVEGQPRHVKMRLPHDPSNLNHLGTIHAGAIFTFAETAGGAAILFSFDMGAVRLLAKGASIEYKRMVTGDLTSEIEVPSADVDRVMVAVNGPTGRATYDLPIVLKDHTGEVAANVTIQYHFKKL